MCRVEGERHGNVLLRREQYRIADDEKRSLPIARNMIGAKTVNARTVLNRFMRDHPMAYDNDRILSAAEYLKDSLPKIHESPDTDTLRGYEGVNATCYFGVFDSMILQNKDVFSFSTREKRAADRIRLTLCCRFHIQCWQMTARRLSKASDLTRVSDSVRTGSLQQAENLLR